MAAPVVGLGAAPALLPGWLRLDRHRAADEVVPAAPTLVDERPDPADRQAEHDRVDEEPDVAEDRRTPPERTAIPVPDDPDPEHPHARSLAAPLPEEREVEDAHED